MRRATRRGHREPVLAPRSGHAGCRGKRQYANHSEATKVAETMRRHTDEAVHAYRCRCCQRWHLGSSLGVPTHVER